MLELKDVATLYDLVKKGAEAQQTINALLETIKFKDKITYTHVTNVAKYSVDFAQYLNIKKEDIEILYCAALLHDIGKIGVPDNILNKNDKLNNYEFDKIKKHPQIGVEILSRISSLSKECDIILHHHERIDGKGYPCGLKGNNISILTKILTICDSYDAMTSNRPYRNGMSLEKAFEQLFINANKQFDTELVNKFKEFMVQQK